MPNARCTLADPTASETNRDVGSANVQRTEESVYRDPRQSIIVKMKRTCFDAI